MRQSFTEATSRLHWHFHEHVLGVAMALAVAVLSGGACLRCLKSKCLKVSAKGLGSKVRLPYLTAATRATSANRYQGISLPVKL